MRQSRASAAYIERRLQGRIQWLTHWSNSWHAFHLVGGHKREEETFRECLCREVSEELGLAEGTQFNAGAEPLARLEYTAWSESAQVETAYTLEVYRVELIGDHVEDKVSCSLDNQWVTEDEVRTG